MEGLIGAMVDVICSRGVDLRLTCSKKRVFIEYFVQAFGRHATLNSEFLEHRNLLISILNLLPDIKKQSEDNAVGWTLKPFAIT